MYPVTWQLRRRVAWTQHVVCRANTRDRFGRGTLLDGVLGR
jgi:hypothetical protein